MFKQFDNLIDKLLLFLLFWYIPSSRIMYTPCICIISYIKKRSIFCQKIKLYLKRKSYSFISLNRSTNVTICVQREKYYFLFFSINGQNNVNMDNIITTHPAKRHVWVVTLYDRNWWQYYMIENAIGLWNEETRWCVTRRHGTGFSRLADY